MLPTRNAAGREERLEEVILAYLEAVDGGQVPDVEQLLAYHADLAVDLQAFFADQRRLSPFLEPLRELAPPTSLPDLPLESFGDYEILAPIARGGMGVVYKARQLSLDRLVALKVIRHRQLADADDLRRFRTEAENAARLDHPHIVPIYEVGEWRPEQDSSPVPYFCMKLIAGDSLAAWLAAWRLPRVGGSGPSPWTAGQTQMAQLMATVARAVHHAHQRGILHRDLKPANILLQYAEDSQEKPLLAKLSSATPLVTDFGLAKHVANPETHSGKGSLTHSGAILGTPQYMAPEQACAAKDLSTAVDIYSLGAILYELLTGQPPFHAASVLETLEQVRTQEPIPLNRLQPLVARDLQTICLKCLEKDPRRRYVSAQALADDLNCFLAGKPIAARPIGLWERFWKWTRRRPALAALVAVCVLSALALTAGVLLYNAWLQQAVDQAETNAKRAIQKQQLADDRYRAARASLRQMVNRFDGDRLANVPRLLEYRLGLLEDALAFYQTVLNQAPEDPDPTVRLDVAFVLSATGSAQFLLGRHGPARTNLERAVALLKELLKEIPPQRAEYPSCCGELGDCHCYLGCLDQGHRQWAAAERHFQAALVVYQQAAERQPANPKWLDDQGRAEHLLGGLQQILEHRQEAIAHYQKSMQWRTQLVAAYPKEVQYRVFLAETELNLGLLHYQLGRLPQAQAANEKTIALFQPLTVQHPENITYRLSLAAVCVNQGNLLMSLGKHVEAAQTLDLGIAAAEAVLQREPRHGYAQERGFKLHGTRAQLHEKLKQWSAAAKHWSRALELNSEPHPWRIRLLKVVNLARAGDHAHATAEAQALARDSQVSDEGLKNLGSLFAFSIAWARTDSTRTPEKRAALVEEYGGRAVALFQKLQDKGYFQKNPQSAKALVDDFGLLVLYPRPDFQKLLKQVKSGMKKSP